MFSGGLAPVVASLDAVRMVQTGSKSIVAAAGVGALLDALIVAAMFPFAVWIGLQWMCLAMFLSALIGLCALFAVTNSQLPEPPSTEQPTQTVEEQIAAAHAAPIDTSMDNEE